MRLLAEARRRQLGEIWHRADPPRDRSQPHSRGGQAGHRALASRKVKPACNPSGWA